jgi:3',5'-cyclic AMP phosphodiesterase CpdA
MRRPVLLSAVVACALLAGVAPADATITPPVPAAAPVADGPSRASAPEVAERTRRPRIVRLVAAGDIADNGGQQMATAATAASLDPDRVIALGDLAYDSGTIEEFRTRWAPSWGRFDDIALTVPGNHEYYTENAAGYREYFGVTGRTWWAMRAGRWVVIGLDSERPNSRRQLAFVRRVLENQDGRPTVVVWHRPRYSSGGHGDSSSVDRIWRTVSADDDVRIALWGHDHSYEHLAVPIAGRSTKVHAFVVGTGGTALRPFTREPSPHSITRVDDHHGVLVLRLGATRWSWAFVQTDGVRPERGWRDL